MRGNTVHSHAPSGTSGSGLALAFVLPLIRASRVGPADRERSVNRPPVTRIDDGRGGAAQLMRVCGA